MSLTLGEHPLTMTVILTRGSDAHLVVPAATGILDAPELRFGPDRGGAPSVTHALALEFGEWVTHLSATQVNALSTLQVAQLVDGNRVIAAGSVEFGTGWDGRASRINVGRIIWGGGGGATSLGGLSDVDTSTTSAGELLMLQSDGSWAGGSVSAALDASGATEGQVLTADGAGGTEWGDGGGPVAWAEVQGKPDLFPPAAHNHTISEVSGLQGLAPLDSEGRLDAPVLPERIEGSTELGRDLLTAEDSAVARGALGVPDDLAELHSSQVFSATQTFSGTLRHTGEALGFYGSAGVPRPVLNYSRDGETAQEAQLRAVLVALGLVADETTVTPPTPYTLTEFLLGLGPVYLLTLDEAAGAFEDATGSGHDGTPVGSLTRGQSSLVPSDTDGKSVTFDGATSYVEMPTGVVPTANLLQGAFTLAFTIQASTPGEFDRIYYEGASTNAGASFNFLPATDPAKLQVQFRDDAGTFLLDGAPSTVEILDGAPHFVVFTYDAGEASWWVDGEVAGGATVSQPTATVVLDDDLSTAPLGSNPTSYLQANWDATVSSVTMSRASVVQEADNRFIRIQYPQGITGATNSGASWRGHFPGAMEVTCRYRVRFDSGFDWTEGGKLPGLAGGSSPSGGTPKTDGFSARYMWKPNGGLIVYLYHSEQPGQYGQAFNLNQTLARGVWHTLEQRIKLNTPGQANGALEVWVNGSLAFQKSNLRWRLGSDNWLIDSFYFSTFHGGTGAAYQPNRDNHIDFDDFVITAGEGVGAGTFTAPRVTWGAFGRTTPTDFFDGGLDALAGFTRALTGPEITAAYEAWLGDAA